MPNTDTPRTETNSYGSVGKQIEIYRSCCKLCQVEREINVQKSLWFCIENNEENDGDKDQRAERTPDPECFQDAPGSSRWERESGEAQQNFKAELDSKQSSGDHRSLKMLKEKEWERNNPEPQWLFKAELDSYQSFGDHRSFKLLCCLDCLRAVTFWSRTLSKITPLVSANPSSCSGPGLLKRSYMLYNLSF